MTTTAQRKKLVQDMPPITHMIRGSLLREYHEGCDCHPNGRYGPYWRLSVKREGRTKMYQLKPHQVLKVREALKNYELWWKNCLRIFELNTQAILAEPEA